MSAEAQPQNATTGKITVRDLATIDDGVAGPSGDKANLIRDKAAENLDMSVVEFCDEVIRCNDIIADTPSESYVRHVLREARPESITMFDNDEITFA